MSAPIAIRPADHQIAGDAPETPVAAGRQAVAASEWQPSREEQRAAFMGIFVESLKDTLVREVDAGVEHQLQAAWKQGTLQAQQLQHEQDKHQLALEQALAEFQKTQAALEAENATLKQAVAGLAGRMTQITDAAAQATWATTATGSSLIAASPIATSPIAASPIAKGAPVCPWQMLTPAYGLGSAASLLSAGSVRLPTDQSETSMWYPRFGGMADAPEEAQHVMASSLAARGALPVSSAAAMDLPELPAFPFPHKARKLDAQMPPMLAAMGPTVSAAVVSAASAAAPLISVSETPSAAPFSLAEALGFGDCAMGMSRQSVGGSRSSTPPLGASGPTLARVEEEAEEDADMYVFCLTLRVAEGGELGISASIPSSPSFGLVIDDVRTGSAVDAWNRQCGSSGAPEKVLRPGDKIVRVNDVGDDAQAMLLECESSRLLRLQIVRLNCFSPAMEEDTTNEGSEESGASSVGCVSASGACMLTSSSTSTVSSGGSSAVSSHPVAARVVAAGAVASASPDAPADASERGAAESQRSRACRRGRRGSRAGRGTRGR